MSNTDEITRLRAENKRLERDYNTAQDAHDAVLLENERLRAALRVLKVSLNGLVDSEDAAEIADAIVAGKAIDWDRYPPATRAALEGNA